MMTRIVFASYLAAGCCWHFRWFLHLVGIQCIAAEFSCPIVLIDKDQKEKRFPELHQVDAVQLRKQSLNFCWRCWRWLCDRREFDTLPWCCRRSSRLLANKHSVDLSDASQLAIDPAAIGTLDSHRSASIRDSEKRRRKKSPDKSHRKRRALLDFYFGGSHRFWRRCAPSCWVVEGKTSQCQMVRSSRVLRS